MMVWSVIEYYWICWEVTARSPYYCLYAVTVSIVLLGLEDCLWLVIYNMIVFLLQLLVFTIDVLPLEYVVPNFEVDSHPKATIFSKVYFRMKGKDMKGINPHRGSMGSVTSLNNLMHMWCSSRVCGMQRSIWLEWRGSNFKMMREQRGDRDVVELF